jgi:hypothetical protein
VFESGQRRPIPPSPFPYFGYAQYQGTALYTIAKHFIFHINLTLLLSLLKERERRFKSLINILTSKSASNLSQTLKPLLWRGLGRPGLLLRP